MEFGTRAPKNGYASVAFSFRPIHHSPARAGHRFHGRAGQHARCKKKFLSDAFLERHLLARHRDALELKEEEIAEMDDAAALLGKKMTEKGA